MVLLEPELGLRSKNLDFQYVRTTNQIIPKKSIFTKEETPSCEDRWDHP